ncbi:hypothetical protein PoB_002899200 [Plakobranchus ocellatus]|uniref:Uncharacterized protein n=1 Tax=Plakobranchus ocellatus TaxID=259542 RepID=A0AAV4A6K9_9GAST|nr:hypothetical protein PoB_002899200 [Plakobranchus ocellatus]
MTNNSFVDGVNHRQEITTINTTIEDLNNLLTGVLNQHAFLKTMTVTDRHMAKWFPLHIKAAKKQRSQAERRYRRFGLEVHRKLYQHQHSAVILIMQKN